MAKNVMTPKSMDKSASDSTPAGTKTLDPAPGGGMIRNIDGPKIHAANQKGGDLVNSNGMDARTTVENP